MITYIICAILFCIASFFFGIVVALGIPPPPPKPHFDHIFGAFSIALICVIVACLLLVIRCVAA